jgi:hypothetical protein
MARFAPAVRPHDCYDPTVGVMVRSMASTTVEQNETSAPQERLDLGEPDCRRRLPHLVDQLIDLAHTRALSF